MRLAAAFLLAVLVAVLQACSTGCDDAVITRAVTFIDAHQTCAVDNDCVVIRDFCEEIPGGFCGQLSMNREGANAPEWASITHELADCAPDSCAVCEAALIPTCTDGTCR